MSKVIQDEGPATPVSSTEKELVTNSQDSYACTECPSEIEIISIDTKKKTITFNCKNHGKKTMPIDEYISLMEKNTYLFSKCSICSLRQNENKDIPIFSYCIRCQQIICCNQECINKHFNNNKVNHENNSNEYFIDNNKRGIKCILHFYKKNEAYCFDCNRHLCSECLRSGIHKLHRKVNMIEIIPSDEFKEKFNDMIKIFQGQKLQLEQEKKNKEEMLRDEEQKEIEKLNNIFSKNLEENQNKLENELNNLKLKYENDVELLKIKYEELKNKFTNDYNKNKKEINITFDERNKNLECKKKIKDIDNLLLINLIIKNAQEKYENNYFNNNNFNNVIQNYYNSQDDNIKQLFEQNENDNIYNKPLNKGNEEKKCLKNNVINEKKNLNEIDKPQKGKIINLEEGTLKNNNFFSSDPNNINSSFNLVENSYSDYFDQNSFLVYNSINNNNLILVYSTNQKSIIFYDIISKKNIHEIEKAHTDYIVSFRFNLNSNKNNILLSVTQSDIKLWDINNNYNCILHLNNIYDKESVLSSACLLNLKNNNNVIITCSDNYSGTNNENVKIYNFKGDKINEIENSNDKIYFIDTCYDNINSKYYIITTNLGSVKSFDYDAKKEYHKYCDNNDEKDLNQYHISAITYINKEKLELIESCKYGKIRIWDFHMITLLNKIYFDNISPNSLCLWNDKYLFFGTEENGIKLVDIEGNNLSNSLGDQGLCGIIKIKHPEFGECLLSQGEEESSIKIWMHKSQ